MSIDPEPPEEAAGHVTAALEESGRLPDKQSYEELNTQLWQLTADQHLLRRLLDAVVAISADMDPRAVLQHIVEAAADLIAARYGALGVLGDSGDIVDLITVGVDDEKLRAASGLPQGHGLLRGLIAECQPLRVDEIAADPRSAGFPPDHPVMTTLLGVPLTVRDTLYGTLYLADKLDGAPFSEEDQALLTALASAASVSIENARLYERLRRTAENFQRRLLPTLPDLSPLAVEGAYQPASELPRLGGDWYDALLLPDGATCVVIGDVTGHDVEAAPLMGQIRNMLRALAYDHGGPPSLIVSRLDHALTMFDDPPTATLVCGRIEEGRDGYTFRWSNAGHLPPLLIGADGDTGYLAPTQHGIPVGIDPSIPRFTHEHPLPPGSTLLLFTDGLVERRDRDIDTGLTALAAHAARLATAPLPQLCADLVAGHDQAFDDDVALLALRIPDSRSSAAGDT
ncbi:PP2C family protein-serine/threonine phosphatase [Streptomyces sp. NBC_01643]|uniref:PP2C family protein-serine/threonine phosphatase n=1 Tax=Streptomyces sp. NBC_01643 TaxID=2975906 RepID=UPI0038661286|nr:SpoIIE family protein phosphatase [Streptomyces sp. NBC_01643]